MSTKEQSIANSKKRKQANKDNGELVLALAVFIGGDNFEFVSFGDVAELKLWVRP